MLDLERVKENFKEHIATFTDYGTIKILDFKRPDSSHYRIRFLFEEDYCRLHISGDLGSLVATNYNNMTYEGFNDYVHNTGYFKEKIDCIERAIYYYDDDLARKELKERLEEYGFEPEFEFETMDDKIDEIMWDFSDANGIGSKGYDVLTEIDPDCWEYISTIGRESTGILEVYMLAFELAQKQLEEQDESK
jgi:hypothetical protein